jgi:hypothetical protein
MLLYMSRRITMDFRFTMTLSFMVQHLEFLHVVYMGVALIVLNK